MESIVFRCIGKNPDSRLILLNLNFNIKKHTICISMYYNKDVVICLQKAESLHIQHCVQFFKHGHCTLGKAMKIKKKKCLKVNIYFCSALNENRWFLFEKVKNYQYFATNIFSRERCDLFRFFGQKNWKGWPDNFETFHKENSSVLEKKPRKQKFYGGSPSCYLVL